MAQLKNTIDLVKKKATDLPPPDIFPDKIQETAQRRREAYDRLNLCGAPIGRTLSGLN